MRQRIDKSCTKRRRQRRQQLLQRLALEGGDGGVDLGHLRVLGVELQQSRRLRRVQMLAGLGQLVQRSVRLANAALGEGAEGMVATQEAVAEGQRLLEERQSFARLTPLQRQNTLVVQRECALGLGVGRIQDAGGLAQEVVGAVQLAVFDAEGSPVAHGAGHVWVAAALVLLEDLDARLEGLVAVGIFLAAGADEALPVARVGHDNVCRLVLFEQDGKGLLDAHLRLVQVAHVVVQQRIVAAHLPNVRVVLRQHLLVDDGRPLVRIERFPQLSRAVEGQADVHEAGGADGVHLAVDVEEDLEGALVGLAGLCVLGQVVVGHAHVGVAGGGGGVVEAVDGQVDAQDALGGLERVGKVAHQAVGDGHALDGVGGDWVVLAEQTDVDLQRAVGHLQGLGKVADVVVDGRRVHQRVGHQLRVLAVNGVHIGLQLQQDGQRLGRVAQSAVGGGNSLARVGNELALRPLVVTAELLRRERGQDLQGPLKDLQAGGVVAAVAGHVAHGLEAVGRLQVDLAKELEEDGVDALEEAAGVAHLVELVERPGQVGQHAGGLLRLLLGLGLGQLQRRGQVPVAQPPLDAVVQPVKAQLALLDGAVDVVAVLLLEGLGPLSVDAHQRVGNDREALGDALQQRPALVGRQANSQRHLAVERAVDLPEAPGPRQGHGIVPGRHDEQDLADAHDVALEGAAPPVKRVGLSSVLVVAEEVKVEEERRGLGVFGSVLVGVLQHDGEDVAQLVLPCVRDKDLGLANVNVDAAAAAAVGRLLQILHVAALQGPRPLLDNRLADLSGGKVGAVADKVLGRELADKSHADAEAVKEALLAGDSLDSRRCLRLRGRFSFDRRSNSSRGRRGCYSRR
eukprot:m.145073 g.145073  ORF g.145073 m.145073 type:complete len:853 (-) comp16778_c0_seq16:338-2896(-)